MSFENTLLYKFNYFQLMTDIRIVEGVSPRSKFNFVKL